MDIKRIEFINDYAMEHADDDFVYLNLHSLFNCLTEEEISHLYFSSSDDNPILKKTLISYILKRTTTEPIRRFEKIARSLLDAYSGKEYKKQIATRIFISQFVRTLLPNTIRIFFDLLISSDRIVDRRRAGEVADLIWCDEVEGRLLDNFYRFKDEESLIPLVNCLPAIELCQLIEKCWSADFPSYRAKNAILKRIASAPIEYLVFLKHCEPCYFVQAMASRKEKVDKETINNLIKSMTGDNEVYLVWHLGLIGDWNLVVKHLNK